MKFQFNQLIGTVLAVSSLASAGPISLQSTPRTNVTTAFEKRMNAEPDPLIFLGYRTVTMAELNRYAQNNNWVNWQPGLNPMDGGSQLGPGLYLSPQRGQFDGEQWNDGYCAILTQQSNFESIAHRAWIPKSKTGYGTLWYNVQAMTNYLYHHLHYSYSMANTLMFAKISGMEPLIQLKIPVELLHKQTVSYGNVVHYTPLYYAHCVTKHDTVNAQLLDNYGSPPWNHWGVAGAKANYWTAM